MRSGFEKIIHLLVIGEGSIASRGAAPGYPDVAEAIHHQAPQDPGQHGPEESLIAQQIQ
jgi:hypothetical protein